MTPTTLTSTPIRSSQLVAPLFLGQGLAETYGFNRVTSTANLEQPAGWTARRLLQMSAARGQNSLA